jgi:hypothetical protein
MTSRFVTVLVVLLGSLAVPVARAQTAADTAGIRAAALDYAEGWYTGPPGGPSFKPWGRRPW